MKLTDRLRLKLNRVRSMQDVVEIAARNEIKQVDLELCQSSKFGGLVAFNPEFFYIDCKLGGERVEIHLGKWCEYIPGLDDRQKAYETAEIGVRQLSRNLLSRGIDPNIRGLRMDRNEFLSKPDIVYE